MNEEEFDYVIVVVGTWTSALVMLLSGFAIGWVLKGVL